MENKLGEQRLESEEQLQERGSHGDGCVEPEVPKMQLDSTELPDVTPEHSAEKSKASAAVRRVYDSFTTAPTPHHAVLDKEWQT